MSGEGPTARFGSATEAVAEALDRAQANDVARRLWAADLSLWTQNPLVQNQIADSLGWLRVAESMRAGVDDLSAWSAEIAKQVDDVVLLGMGGSSLAPEVMAAVIPRAEEAPQLTVLDTTDPVAIRRVESGLSLDRSLFIVASKSGGTLETATLAEYFWSRYAASGVDSPGRHFVAITDPGTSLAALAQDHAYARVFLNPPDIGGRYSALSFFGLVPAALAGIDLAPLLDRAIAAGQTSAANASVNSNPPVTIGVALGALARGRPGQTHPRPFRLPPARRRLGRAARRREHRQGRPGHRACRRRAAGRSLRLRQRSCVHGTRPRRRPR